MGLTEKEQRNLEARGWEFMGHTPYETANDESMWPLVREHLEALKGDTRYEFNFHIALDNAPPNRFYSIWRKKRIT